MTVESIEFITFTEVIVHGNDYLTFYNNMEQKRMFVIVYTNPERKATFSSLAIYTNCSIDRQVRKKFMYNTSGRGSFHGQRLKTWY